MRRFSFVDFVLVALLLAVMLAFIMPPIISTNKASQAQTKSLILENLRSDGVSRIEVKDWMPFDWDSREGDAKNLRQKILGLNLPNIDQVSIEKSQNTIEVVVTFKNRQKQ